MDIVLHSTTEAALRSSWMAASIEGYVTWLEGRRAAPSTILRRIPELVSFGDFAKARGVEHPGGLAAHLDAFIASRTASSPRRRTPERQAVYARELRAPVLQMLVALGHVPSAPSAPEPTFGGLASGFLDALREERGLSAATLSLYRAHLVAFQAHLAAHDVGLASLSPSDIDGFISALGSRMVVASLTSACSALRHLLRWLFREGRHIRDLSGCVGKPQAYRLATIPRSIPWEDVQRTLTDIDQRSITGKRDFAMLLLLVLYGLRAREVAALTLDDIDWRAETLHVPHRKCGHSTQYPLSPIAGKAIVAYLRVRPKTSSRRVFIQAASPFRPVTHAVVSSRAQHHLRQAGVEVRRLGSHTLRHSCAQHLLDADFSLKVIGDYLGHGAPSSTEIYTKVAIESLRKVALGNGEEVLCPLHP